MHLALFQNKSSKMVSYGEIICNIRREKERVNISRHIIMCQNWNIIMC
mgnify:CR=1 FL=1